MNFLTPARSQDTVMLIDLNRGRAPELHEAGGITEEATVLGVPCLTLRDTTERPETVTIGTDPARLKPALDRLFAGQWKQAWIAIQECSGFSTRRLSAGNGGPAVCAGRRKKPNRSAV